MPASPTDSADAGPVARLLDDPRVSVAEMDPRQASPGIGLYAEEVAAVDKAVLSRRQQFTAGRTLARQAWQRLGLTPAPLLSDAQRVPVWPRGIVGTITHTHTWCAAAVARQGEVAALGADVELATALELNLWDRICRPEERAFLQALREPLSGLLAKAIFSAKESIYKALYPNVRVFLDFQGMHIALERGESEGLWTWQATLQTPWGSYAPGQRFAPGKLSIGSELIASAVVW
ncbi:MAG TPA: 4'-phosphopantetheinyl transferase superfamily protein [Polyangiaceae bacterium]|nr:4'-phosphopantetheinyl transferase superfamily protein [Polyangiaceae bacterium]